MPALSDPQWRIGQIMLGSHVDPRAFGYCGWGEVSRSKPTTRKRSPSFATTADR